MSEQTILDKLLKSTFSVPSKSIPDEEFACRDLPFTTMTYILGKVAENTRTEVLAERDRLIRLVTELAADGNEAKNTQQKISEGLQLGWPLIASMVMDSEEFTLRVFKDVIVGTTDEHIRAISVPDMISILNKTLSRIDPDDLAEEIKSVFSQAVVVWNKATAAKDEEEQKENSETNTPSSPQEAL